MKILKILAVVAGIAASQSSFADTRVVIGVGGNGGGISIGAGRGQGDGWRRGEDWGRGDRWNRRPSVCVARNAIGRTFQARGRAPLFQLRNFAMNQCRRNSILPFTCRIVYCR